MQLGYSIDTEERRRDLSQILPTDLCLAVVARAAIVEKPTHLSKND